MIRFIQNTAHNCYTCVDVDALAQYLVSRCGWTQQGSMLTKDDCSITLHKNGTLQTCGELARATLDAQCTIAEDVQNMSSDMRESLLRAYQRIQTYKARG